MVFIKSVVDGTVVFSSEPFHSLILGDSVLGTNGTFASSSKSNSASGSLQDHVKVHSENTSEGVIFDSQIDVLLNTESKTS